MGPGGSKILAVVILVAVAIWGGLSYIGAHAPATADVGQKVAVVHTQSGNRHTYSGTLVLPACTELAAGLTSVGLNPAHLTLKLTLAALPACTGGSPAQEDFTLSYESLASASPVLDGVMLDGHASAFTLANR